MNSKRPRNLNRRRSHALLRWRDVQLAITFAAFAAASWLVGYGIGNLISMFQYKY